MARAGCRYVYTGLESLNPDSIKSMNKGQNKISEVDRVIRRFFENGVMLSFGLLVGSDGDASEYLERLPDYLSELRYFNITFLGIPLQHLSPADVQSVIGSRKAEAA